MNAAQKEVRAAAFGYRVDDATTALLGAIASVARRVIVENMGTPWIVSPLELASDHEIVFKRLHFY